MRKAAGLLARDPDDYRAGNRGQDHLGPDHEQVVERADGRTIAVTTRPLPGGSWVSIHEDITDRRRAENRIEYLAHHDALTELPNRAVVQRVAARTTAKAAERTDAFAILSIDLDRFKEVNDVFGHATGDALLREVARGCRMPSATPSWRGSAATNSS